MKKKFGFTLAEVLITLGIIGVVAALTAPALVKNSGQAKIGPQLAKFVNTWETASEQLMMDEGVSRLTSIVPYDGGSDEDSDEVKKQKKSTFQENLPKKLSKYMIMSPTDKKFIIVNPDNTSRNTYDKNNYVLKDGTIIHVSFHMSKYGAKGAYLGNIGELYVGLKGPDKENKVARDAFLFKIDDSGLLVPYCSNTLKWLDDSGYYTNEFCKCDPNHKDGSDGKYHAVACTGAIADNGWKADY